MIENTESYVEYLVEDPAVMEYPYSFPVTDITTVKVYVIDAQDEKRQLGDDEYIVTANNGNPYGGGSVTLRASPAVGETIRVQRETVKWQSQQFRNQDDIEPETVGRGLDRLTMIVIELEAMIPHESMFKELRHSIEDLADQLAEQAVSVNNRFSSVSSQISTINGTLASLQQQITKLDGEFVAALASIATRFQAVEKRLSQHDTDIAGIRSEMSSIQTSLTKRCDAIDKKVDTLSTSVDKAVATITTRLDSLDGRLTALEATGGLPVGGIKDDILAVGSDGKVVWRTPTEITNTMPHMSSDQLGVAKMGDGLAISTGGVLYTTGSTGGGDDGGSAFFRQTDNSVLMRLAVYGAGSDPVFSYENGSIILGRDVAEDATSKYFGREEASLVLQTA